MNKGSNIRNGGTGNGGPCILYHSGQILAPLVTDIQSIRTRWFLWSPDIIELNKQISNLASQDQLLTMLNEKGDDTIAPTQELIESLDADPDFMDTFDGEPHGELVEKIILGSNNVLRFRLKVDSFRDYSNDQK